MDKDIQMNCYYHPDRNARTQCSVCNRNLCEECADSQEKGAPICSRCMALKAAEDTLKGIDNRLIEKEKLSEERSSKRRRRRNFRFLIEYGLLIIGLIIIVLQAPKIFNAFEKEKPLRIGSYETDARTDQCIRNLWKISKLLQEGKLPENDILSPADNSPYEIIKTNSDVIVRTPNPELYGFSEIRVSKLKPVPELIK